MRQILIFLDLTFVKNVRKYAEDFIKDNLGFLSGKEKTLYFDYKNMAKILFDCYKDVRIELIFREHTEDSYRGYKPEYFFVDYYASTALKYFKEHGCKEITALWDIKPIIIQEITGGRIGYSICSNCKHVDDNIYLKESKCNSCGLLQNLYKNFEFKEEEKMISVKEENDCVKPDMVNHPPHYEREGAMECIDEMVMIFGYEATMNFCKCNAWKYRYRAADKNGAEDIAKSDWYMNKYKELDNKCYGSKTCTY